MSKQFNIPEDDDNLIKLKKLKRAFSFSAFIVAHPFKNLIISFVLVAILLPGVLFVKSKWSTRIWYDEDHPQMVRLNQFEEQFGGDVFASIALHHPDGIFQEDVLKKVIEISDDFWLVKDVMRVESLTNYNMIHAEGDEIIIEPFFHEDTDYSPDNLKVMQKKALEDAAIPNILLSYDGTYTMIYAYLRPIFDQVPDYSTIVTEVRALMKKHEMPGVDMYVLGGAPANHAFKEVSERDNMLILPFMFIFLLLLLYTQFRSFISVILPLALIGLSIGVTFGLMGHVGIFYNSLLAAIPGVLLAICIADAVHILNSYFHYRELQYKSKQSLLFALTKNFQPTVLTSISTAISFFSLSISEIAPIRDLGLLCGAGTLFAWVFTYMFVGPWISILSNLLDRYQLKSLSFAKLFGFSKKSSQTQADDNKDAKASARLFTNMIYRFRYLITTSFIALTILSVFVAMKNEVNSDPIKYFSPEVPLRAAYDFAGTKIDGLRGLEFVADSGQEEGIKEPAFLRKLDNFIDFLEKDPQISQVQSTVHVIKRMNQTLNGDDPNFYKIPDSNKTVAEELFLYSMGLPQGMDLNNQFTLDNRKMRIKVVWNIDTSKEAALKMDYILAEAKKRDLTFIAVGNGPLNLSMNKEVVNSFFKSMMTALILVSLLLYFVYRDFYISVLSLLPNMIPLCFGGALMYILGKPIDMGTSIVCTVCLGIAVDDTIHFISSYKQYRKQGHDVLSAITEVFSVTGKALVVTTILLVVGFGSFIFATFVPNHNFGMLCALILAMALITDLLFLPALLMVADRK
jgi:predicted RND superfamily exporter protein